MDRNANVFKFQASKMIVSGKGPNFTINTSFRPNLLSSSMNMPRNFEKQSSAASVASSQRSIYHRRDTSPTASVRNDMQPRNFHQPFYSRGFSQRSVYNDRAVSPVSMRSIDSTASRADIVIDAIKACTEDEWGKIWHAVNRKHEFRKKAQKRRKMKMFLKNLRNRSDDEGEQGSHSSISNDDCMSTRTGYSRKYRYDPYCKENIPRSMYSYDCRSEDMYRNSFRDSGYSKSDLRNPYQIDDSAYRPANMFPYQKQPQFGPMYFSQRNGLPQNQSAVYPQNNTTCGPKNSSPQGYKNGQANISSIQRNTLNASICSTKSMQSMSMMSQRDRFRGGFQFPSQKFNRSTLYEEHEKVKDKPFPKKDYTNKEKNICRDQINEESDENDGIFLDTTVKPKMVTKKSEKRKAESLDDIPNPVKKKPKMTSSNDKVKKQIHSKDSNQMNEFEFVKPQFPARKSAPAKPREKIISKSSGAPDILCSPQENKNPQPQPVQAPSPEPEIREPEQPENTELTTSDLSMRPSFMKRKLFTQTLDVTERKNNSFDSGSADSPQNNIYSALSREKHKTRKLVSSHSLLSRDVNQDDDNLLDLIHKIVPPKQVNSTVSANTTKPRVSGTKTGDDKWDITSIISTCNNDSVSETYTDDEIFRVGNDDTKNKPQEKPVKNKNKQDVKNKVANKSESKKADNNVNVTNNKNNKDIGDVKSKNNKNGGNINAASNKNVKSGGDGNSINKKDTEEVGDVKATNDKNIKDGELKLSENKIIQSVCDAKPANNRNFRDVGNMKINSNKKIKVISDIKLTNNKIIKDIVDVKLSESRNVSKNPVSNQNVKDSNKLCTNSKNYRKVVKETIQLAPKMDTPVKPCPAKKVMLSRSRIDAFWDTDESDYECAGAPRDLQPTRTHHQDLTRNHVASLKQSEPDTQTTSSTKVSKTNRNEALSPVVVLQDIKALKKQVSKKTAHKDQSKTQKKPDNNCRSNKSGEDKNYTPNTSLRPRTINLSDTLESVNNSDLKENVTTKTGQKKQKTAKKETKDKNNKTKPTAENPKSQNKKRNDSLIDSKKRTDTPRSLRHSKSSKLQNPPDHMKICKVLRSRNIDLSSSFNSDKFELTMSRTRKSRTPSKRISFNKSKNMLANNKIRNKATKS